MDRKAWRSPVLLGSGRERLHSLQEKQMPWRRLCPLSHPTSQGSWKNAQHPSRKGDLLQVPLTSLLTIGMSCFICLPKKLGRKDKGCNATRQSRATWKSWKKASSSCGVNDANIWLCLPLKTPIFRLPSPCPGSWAGPEHHSTLKPQFPRELGKFSQVRGISPW